MSDAPDNLLNQDCQPGNVYRNQQGRLYVIVSTTDRNSICLVVDKQGAIVGAQSYGTSYFERLPLVGRANLPEFISVDWMI